MRSVLAEWMSFSFMVVQPRQPTWHLARPDKRPLEALQRQGIGLAMEILPERFRKGLFVDRRALE